MAFEPVVSSCASYFPSLSSAHYEDDQTDVSVWQLQQNDSAHDSIHTNKAVQDKEINI